MKDCKISVLVPIYNSSEYLEECLNSLKNQTLKEVEFILINDGSTDNSSEIMKKYKELDSRFRIINKENTGYGDSLNKGIKIARGKYIGIVEPDDFCNKNMFEILGGLIEEDGADIVRGGYYYHSEKDNRIRRTIFADEKKRVFYPIKDYRIFCEPPAIWSAIYRKDFLRGNNIEFLPTPGASYQDTGFYIKTLVCANRVVFIDKPLYYYRVDNCNSSVNDKSKIMAVVNEYREIEKFVAKLSDGDLWLRYCQAAKFGSYNWNLSRLSGREEQNFIALMKREFSKEKRVGNIKKEYFSKKYWISLKLLLGMPVWFYKTTFDFKRWMKGVIIK
ncbi:glycosyltransferase [Candidatus Saccharibacteria bacterium]|nr:glycosyltransferase [Candidatus Saccharibacteria bacterium]